MKSSNWYSVVTSMGYYYWADFGNNERIDLYSVRPIQGI